MTLILIMSSVTMVLALKQVIGMTRKKVTEWMFFTIIAERVVGSQAWEWGNTSSQTSHGAFA